MIIIIIKIINRPLYYSHEEISTKFKSSLVIHQPERIYDFRWFPKMNSYGTFYLTI